VSFCGSPLNQNPKRTCRSVALYADGMCFQHSQEPEQVLRRRERAFRAAQKKRTFPIQPMTIEMMSWSFYEPLTTEYGLSVLAAIAEETT
jgi:hypothetical protein